MINGKAPDPSILRAAGQCLLVGFHGKAPGDLSEALTDALREGHVGGVILFSRNIDDSSIEGMEALAGLNAHIHACVGEGLPAPFVAVDQEGGRVRRLKHNVTPVPPMADVGRAGSRELAAQVSEVVAAELGALGFNLNFAPVLDVFTNEENTVIGDRAFSTSPNAVAEMAGAFTVGHYTHCVIPCGKHFPGHGDTKADSHFELPILLHGPDRLESIELLPFARAVQAKIPMLMTAHILVPSIDALHPITLSEAGIGRLLREEMGFEGVVITDDLEMKAVAERYSVEAMVELGLAAGVDIFLVCHTEAKWQAAFDHLVHLAESDDVARERLLAAAARVERLKVAQLPRGRYTVPEDLAAELQTPTHLEIMRRLEEAVKEAS